MKGDTAAAAVDGQLSEDEKIDKFFSLIKTYKEARDRIARQQPSLSTTTKRKRSPENEDRSRSIWTPAFKSEDFTQVSSPIQLSTSPEASPNHMHGDGSLPTETDGAGLDLRLRLALLD